MTLSEIRDVLKAYMDASLGVNGEITKKADEALEALDDYCWKNVFDGDGELPELEMDEEGGTSDLILLSFANASIPCIGRYVTQVDGSGAFYEGDEDEEPLSDFDLIVNAWAKIPENCHEDR